MDPLIHNACSPDFFTRHGSLLSLAAALDAISKHHARRPYAEILHRGQPTLSPAAAQAIADIVCQIERERLWAGSKGKIIRHAACLLVSSVALLELPLLSRQQPRAQHAAQASRFRQPRAAAKPQTRVYLDFLQDSLKHPDEAVESAAAAAMRAFSSAYMRGRISAADASSLIAQYHKIILHDPNLAAKRGFALALGSLDLEVLARSPADLASSYRLLQATASLRPLRSKELSSLTTSSSSSSSSSAVVENESNVSRPTRPADPDTRRNAILSLHHLTLQVLARPELLGEWPLGQSVAETLDILLEELDDFSVDNRGDVGSWARKASLDALLDLKAQLSPQQAERFLQRLFMLVSERLARLREHAGAALVGFLAWQSSSAERPALEHGLSERLLQWLGGLSWSDAGAVFRTLARDCYPLGRFSGAIVEGMLATAKGSSKLIAVEAQGEWLRLLTAALGSGGEAVEAAAGHIVAGLEAIVRGSHASKLLPSLKTLNFLLVEHRAFRERIGDMHQQFAQPVMRFLAQVTRQSRDLRVLCVSIEFLCRFGQLFAPPSRLSALSMAAAFLGHAYPRIRKHCAECLYTTFLSASWFNDPSHPLMGMLIETPWLSENEPDWKHPADQVAQLISTLK